MIRLLLADDHVMLREGLRSKFAEYPDIAVIAEAGHAGQLLGLLPTHRPDVVILDLKLPDTNGLALLKRIKDMVPGSRVVVLTMYDHVRYAQQSIDRGADGFVVKGAPFEELVQAVRDAAQGRRFVCSHTAAKLAGRRRMGRARTLLETLSPREFEVFTMFSGGTTVKATAQQLGISEKSVTTYRTRLKNKLHLSTNAALIRFAIESGLLE